MRPGRAYVDVSCDDGFELTLTLPGEVGTTISTRRLNADSYHADNTETGDPTTIDVHSVGYEPADALTEARRVAGDLGIDARGLDRFPQDVAAAGEENHTSAFVRTTRDYLTAELQLQYLGASGTTYVHVVLSWS